MFESPQELDVDAHYARIVQLIIEEHDIQRMVIDGMTAKTKYVARRNVQNMNVWTKLRRLLEDAAIMLSNAHAVPHHELLRAVVDG